MNTENQLKKQLADLEKRVTILESRVSPIVKKPKQTSKPMTLAKHILALRDSAFFSQDRTADEVHKKLSSHYNCILNRVEVALVRLASKRQLRKATKTIGDKSYKSYVW